MQWVRCDIFNVAPAKEVATEEEALWPERNVRFQLAFTGSDEVVCLPAFAGRALEVPQRGEVVQPFRWHELEVRWRRTVDARHVRVEGGVLLAVPAVDVPLVGVGPPEQRRSLALERLPALGRRNDEDWLAHHSSTARYPPDLLHVTPGAEF